MVLLKNRNDVNKVNLQLSALCSFFLLYTRVAVLIRFEQFRVFFTIHLANFRSVKIAQKSGKIQGIFQLLMSGNPVNTVFIFFIFFNTQARQQPYYKF